MPIPTATVLQVPDNVLAEYALRHEQMWPEMRAAICDQGGTNMSIFAAPGTGTVVLYVEVDDVDEWQRSARSELTQRWWRYMAEIMPTNEDHSPIASELELIFHLE